MPNDVNCKHYDPINGWCEKLSNFGYPKHFEYCPKSPCDHAELIEQVVNDNDIIKTWEHCVDVGDCATCERKLSCIDLPQEVLNLINRQKAEIESLKLINSTYEAETKRVRDIAIKEFAERLRNKFFNYYDGLTEHTSKSNHNGDSLMFYEVADMITDCIESTEKEMTEEKE